MYKRYRCLFGKRIVKHDNRLQTVDGGLHARWEIAISDGEHHWHRLDVVHVENGDSLEFLEWTNVELQARPHLSAIQVSVFHVAFGIEDQAYIGTETQVRIHFGEEAVTGVWARTAADGSDRKSAATSQVVRARLSRRDLI
jgi:hypothetical protein